MGLESPGAILGPKKSKILKVFVSVRGWPGNIFKVSWWSFGMICIVFVIFDVFFDDFSEEIAHGVISRRRFGGRRGDSGTEKIEKFESFCVGSGVAWKHF